MYLSRVILNPRSRQARRDLASPYELHRTILRAFPSTGEGGPGRVLFRIEPPAAGQPPVVLVQSNRSPRWDALRDLDDYTLGVASKDVRLALRLGQRLRFRLRANPSVRRDGKRRGLLSEEQQRAWLRRKASAAGFELLSVLVRRASRQDVRGTKADGSPVQQTHLAAEFEGMLQVIDADRLLLAVESGIGSAKAFGFGLLSLAPAP